MNWTYCEVSNEKGVNLEYLFTAVCESMIEAKDAYIRWLQFDRKKILIAYSKLAAALALLCQLFMYAEIVIFSGMLIFFRSMTFNDDSLNVCTLAPPKQLDSKPFLLSLLMTFLVIGPPVQQRLRRYIMYTIPLIAFITLVSTIYLCKKTFDDPLCIEYGMWVIRYLLISLGTILIGVSIYMLTVYSDLKRRGYNHLISVLQDKPCQVKPKKEKQRVQVKRYLESDVQMGLLGKAEYVLDWTDEKSLISV
ncbi:hypothetical protein FGO68_gene13863 [Halteria grandinella]|uniref:Uncharacterized protein n=1 Tax=Halteria grandinella TaxID=5974 RepID=A0A8J8T0N2_HALGN|nr:hypothetical protein FGO68_gene13863 [Halteria grandinella]